MVIYGVDITGSLFVSGSSNFKGDINVSGSQIVSGSLNVLNSLLLNGQPFVGTQGSQGIQGSIGIQGTTGSNGLQGNQGATGIQGTTGVQGNQGPTGLQGTTGAQGNQGPTGIQGTNGTVGTQGNQGPTGLQGSTGLQGAQGSTGTSAGITGYTNPADNRILTSVSSTSINAESNLTFNGSTLTLTGNAVISSALDVNSFIRNTDSTANSSIVIGAMGTSHYIQSRNANNSADTNLLLNPNGANVGIGTTSPFSKFQVNNGTDINLGIKFGQTDATAVMLNAYNDAVDANIPMEFRASKFAFQNGNVGIGTASPTSNLSFDGSAARTVGMERVTVSNTAGNNLTISASSATVGATDKNGGDVIISGGVATGTGSSRVVFRTATANFSTGTGDRTPSDKVIITGSGTIVQNGVASTFITGTCLANQTVNLSFTTVSGGRLRVHAIITPTDGTSIGAQKMSVIGNSTGGISEVVISNTTTATIGSWTFSGSGTFFGVTKNAGSASTACTYLIEIIGNLA